MTDLQQDVERQIEAQGAAAYKVSDGHILVLTLAMLEKLLAATIESKTDRVVLFIKHGAQA
jgi:hypothetical protein